MMVKMRREEKRWDRVAELEFAENRFYSCI